MSAAPIMEAAPAPWARSLAASIVDEVERGHRYELERLSLRGYLVKCQCGWRNSAGSRSEAVERAHTHRRKVMLERLIREGNDRVFGSPHHVDRGHDRVSCRCGWFHIDDDELVRLEEAFTHLAAIVWSEVDRASALKPSTSAKVVSRRGRRLRGIKAEADAKSA